MFIMTLENECEQYATREECYDVHPNGVNCDYSYFWEGEGEDAIEVQKCVQIIDKDDCQYDPNKHNCFIKPGSEEPDLQACQIQNFGNEVICGLGTASCYHYYASKDKCLKLENCGYDEKRHEYDRCFNIYPEKNEAGCSFTDNKCISDNSNKKICYLVDEEGYIFCKSRNIQCSDLNEDSSSCPKADLEDITKKCSYDASRSSGNKCFEVLIKEGCTYDNDNENKKCQGEYLSDGKICDLDFSANPVSCQKRNLQCGDFDGDENKCKIAKLPDKSKECSYNDQKKCVEKTKDAKCTYIEGEEEPCVSSLPSKIKCELNGDGTGCNSKNVECSDFEDSSSGCNDAILSDSNKKCVYDNSKTENKCSQASKGCSDFYNAQECNSHKPDNSLAKCVWTNECKEMTCETTSTENCGSFKPNDSGKTCALNQDKTQCEEVSEKNGAENLKIFLSIFLLLIIF